VKAATQPVGLGWRQAVFFLIIIGCALVSAYLLTPRERMARFSSDIALEAAIPQTFGNWRIDETQVASVVNPQQADLLKALYSQNLMRTYMNDKGERIMLSISYGSSQGGGVELHRPEVCYAAQGFALEKKGSSILTTQGHSKSISLERLIAVQRGRSEPVSYWMRVGDDLMVSGFSQQLSRIRQGLKGFIPDGVLFRVSSISTDPAPAYALQEQFVQDLFLALRPRDQRFLVGPVSANRDGVETK
jgi:EpsI family protein